MFHSLRPHGLYSPWNSPGQNTGVGCHAVLQPIFPLQELNPGLLHCRRVLYQLSYSADSTVTFGWIITLSGYTTFVFPFIFWGTWWGFLHLAIVNSPAMNIHVHVFAGISIFSCRIQDPMIILHLTFWRTAKLFPTVAAPFYIPISREWGSSFSTSLPTLVVVCLFCFF